MGLTKLLPKSSSFLPGGLAINTGNLYNNAFKGKVTLDEIAKRNIGLICEFGRDVPTMVLLYFGGKELGIGFYALMTWVIDRAAYYGIVSN